MVVKWVLALVLLTAVTAPAAAQTPEAGWWKPTAGMTWQIQLDTPEFDEILPVQVYDLDGFDTDRATVERLHDRDIYAICYFSAGTFEDWRPDADQFPVEVIGEPWDEWEGERFLDIRQIDLLAPIMEARLDMCAEKGFDGVDPDVIDSYWAETGFPLTAEDAIAFSRWLAAEAHERGLAVGQKNAPELTADLIDSFDFTVTEDCYDDGWCNEVSAYTDANKPVFAIEYTDREFVFDEMCASFAETQVSGVLKHRNLDVWAAYC